VTAQALGAAALAAMLTDGQEAALIDLREELDFSRHHLLQARSVPLSRLELLIAPLVPRRSTRLVLCDGGEGLSARAAAILARFGYGNLFWLDATDRECEAADLLSFSGVNVPSKAFGECVEHDRHTPGIDAAELDALIRQGRDLVVLDSRPFDEYERMSIPTAINVPGAELVLRIHDIAPSPATMVVVNCAGRTRSIIGAQSLIDAGVLNRVAALRNGTMGWELAGLACERGKARRAPPVSPAGLAWAKAAAARVADACGVARIDRATLERWQGDSQRTLYLFDVRDPAEYAAGHVAGARSAPGGQLVQGTDHYIGTLNARIVLVDDAEARALMTASWLRRMGWKDVYILAESGRDTAAPATPILGGAVAAAQLLDPVALAALLARNAATVVDLASSREYRRFHIPGAWFAIRARLARALPKIAPKGLLVLTSEDGRLAALAAEEAGALATVPVRVLAGGNAAWAQAGHPVTADTPRLADEPVDLWLKPYERAGGKAAMEEYLSWEVELLDRIGRDRSCGFRV